MLPKGRLFDFGLRQVGAASQEHHTNWCDSEKEKQLSQVSVAFLIWTVQSYWTGSRGRAGGRNPSDCSCPIGVTWLGLSFRERGRPRAWKELLGGGERMLLQQLGQGEAVAVRAISRKPMSDPLHGSMICQWCLLSRIFLPSNRANMGQMGLNCRKQEEGWSLYLLAGLMEMENGNVIFSINISDQARYRDTIPHYSETKRQFSDFKFLVIF